MRIQTGNSMNEKPTFHAEKFQMSINGKQRALKHEANDKT
jgi:hypothetical protein